MLEKACEDVGSLPALLVVIIRMDLPFEEYDWRMRLSRREILFFQFDASELSPKNPIQEISSENGLPDELKPEDILT